MKAGVLYFHNMLSVCYNYIIIVNDIKYRKILNLFSNGFFPLGNFPGVNTLLVMIEIPVVRVRDNATACHTPKVVSTFDIDPSRIIIERCDNETCYHVCRIEGVDTVMSE